MTALLNTRIILVAGLIIAAFAVMASGAFAQGPGGTRPGWGFGDQNHVHTGPPGGPSVHPVK